MPGMLPPAVPKRGSSAKKTKSSSIPAPPSFSSNRTNPPPRAQQPTTNPASSNEASTKLKALQQAISRRAQQSTTAHSSASSSSAQPPAARNSTAPPNRPQSQPQQHSREEIPPLRSKYTVPKWSAPPKHEFHFEVLKSGSIIDEIQLTSPYTIVGRHPLVELTMENPSVSRQHAALQFSEEGKVFLFDLGSTHGTFVNKQR